MTYVMTAVLVSILTLACQKTFGNVVSGVNLFITHPFKKGDKIALRTTAHILSVLNEMLYNFDPLVTSLLEDIEGLAEEGCVREDVSVEDIEER